jgi:hypothetical protein
VPKEISPADDTSVSEPVKAPQTIYSKFLANKKAKLEHPEKTRLEAI